MASALPPVTDCGCSCSSSSDTPSTDACCPIRFVGDPNEEGVVPDDPTQWVEGWQLADLVAGPVVQTWYWNPNLLAWS